MSDAEKDFANTMFDDSVAVRAAQTVIHEAFSNHPHHIMRAMEGLTHKQCVIVAALMGAWLSGVVEAAVSADTVEAVLRDLDHMISEEIGKRN